MCESIASIPESGTSYQVGCLRPCTSRMLLPPKRNSVAVESRCMPDASIRRNQTHVNSNGDHNLQAPKSSTDIGRDIDMISVNLVYAAR